MRVCLKCYQRAMLYQAPGIGYKPLCLFPERTTLIEEECEVHEWASSDITMELLSWLDKRMEGRRRVVAITAYHGKVNIEVIGNCERAIERLEAQVRWKEEAHALAISGLKARIDDCKATISRLTAELEG